MRDVTKIKVYLSIDQEPQQVRFVMGVKQKIKFVNRGCSGERGDGRLWKDQHGRAGQDPVQVGKRTDERVEREHCELLKP